jgi:hypothetical protein
MATVLNVLLTYLAVMYQTVGYGLNPVIAGSIGAVNTLVMLWYCSSFSNRKPTTAKEVKGLNFIPDANDADWYRLYPNGAVFHEDEFNECNENYDDYGTYLVPHDPLEMVLMGKSGELPDELVAYILDADKDTEWLECEDNNLFDNLNSKLR